MDSYIDQLQKLIEGLYSTTEPSVARDIQEQLQNFQRQPQAWEIASQLLGSPSDQCRFFGAHTFQVKIARDWATLPEERVEWLRQELMTWIVKLSSGPLFIITKLCTALITYAFHTVPDRWRQFISDTVITLQSGSQAYGISPSVINTAILEFLTLVPEEISNAAILGGKRPQILQELKDGIPLTLSTLSTFIVSSGPDIDSSNQEKALKCLQSWVQYGIDLEQCYTLIQQTILSLTREDLFSAAADVLLESMQQSAWIKYNTLRNDLLNCFASDWIKEKLSESIKDEDEETARTLAKLLTTFGETYTDYMALELADPKLTLILDMILQLTAFPGHFPADQEVSELPLNFWYVFQETLFDNGIVPLRPNPGISIIAEGATQRNGANQAQQQLWLQQCGEIALARYRQLVTVLRNKAAFPDEAVWNSWTKDIRDKFRTSRRDLGDTLMNPYYLLQNEMLSILLDEAASILNQWNHIPLASQELEATLFCLKSISEEIPADENTQIPRFFGPEVLSRLPPDCGLRLQNTALLLLGSLSEWLKLHSDFLPAVMNYIVPCLSISKLSACAASAFSDICDTCRQFLVGDLDSMMHVYGAMASSMIEPNTMQKVVESVADVIQVLPPERAAAPLMVLVGDILKGLRNALNNSTQDASAGREAVLVQLQYLSACCRGIQSPTDDYQSLTARHNTYDAFASGDTAAFYRNVDGFEEFTAAIRDITQQIALVWVKDEQLMKTLSQFLEAGIRSTSPLLTLSFKDLISLVCSAYQNSPYACWLHTSAFTVTVYGGQTAEHANLRDMLANLTGKTFSVINNSAAMEEYPDIVHSYFDLLTRTIKRCPDIFYQLPHDTVQNIFMFAVAGMGLQERLALQAALNFMADFVTQDLKEGSQHWDIARALLLSMGPNILEQLLAGIGGRVPRSFSGLLVDVLYKMICRYLEPCSHWLHDLLARDGFPSNLATAEDKNAFIKGILGTRSLKKFKQCTHEFSIKCRGLDKTTY